MENLTIIILVVAIIGFIILLTIKTTKYDKECTKLKRELEKEEDSNSANKAWNTKYRKTIAERDKKIVELKEMLEKCGVKLNESKNITCTYIIGVCLVETFLQITLEANVIKKEVIDRADYQSIINIT